MIKCILFVCLVIFSHSAYAQLSYEKHKGFSSYAIIQGTWQDRQSLGSALEMEGLPAPRKLFIHDRSRYAVSIEIRNILCIGR
jgi:hypothetical protein